MAASVSCSTFFLSARLLRSCSPGPLPGKKHRISFSPCCSSSSSPLMDPTNEQGRFSFMDFPYVSSQQRDLMVELVSTLETRLSSFLLPCDLPQNIQYVQNPTGTACATFHIRSGLESSPIDFIFGSWLHCELPSGGAMNITSLSVYLNSSTDAPNFVFELIQGSSTSAVLILDMYPRKDPVLHPDYLTTFYEDTGLDRHQQLLAKLPEVRPYISPSLFLRCFLAPTAILVRVETDETERLQEIVHHHIGPIAKEMLKIWIDVCAFGERKLKETERDHLRKRDQMIKNKYIEIDLRSNLPNLFGQDVAARVVGYLTEVFNL